MAVFLIRYEVEKMDLENTIMSIGWRKDGDDARAFF